MINPVTSEKLAELHPNLSDLLTQHLSLEDHLETISFASNFLTRLLITDPDALAVVIDPSKPADIGDIDNDDQLVKWKRLELLRIATRDLNSIDPLETIAADLAQLAENVLRKSLELTGLSNDIAIVGMGKLGGRELNYASDIDVMFVGEANPLKIRQVLDTSRKCFRVDANLRPEGRNGPLIRSIDSYVHYWSEWAQTWEFQALLKARPIAGNPEIGNEWFDKANEVLWTHHFGPDELRELREMKARSESIVDSKGLSEREVKRGRGGIRDIEFAVQLLQLVHGGADSAIRSPNTLEALADLAEGDYIASDDATSLADSYRFLRNVEHRLQLVEEQQTHTVPTEPMQRMRLARTMSFTTTEDFDIALRKHQAQVRSAHERLYFRPLLEAFAGHISESDELITTRLAAFGFTDANRTRQAVAELTKGLTRSSRLMQQLMPVLLDWLSNSPDPDEGLLGLRTLIEGFHTPQEVVSIFRDSPEAARRLCLLLGTSRMFSRTFDKHPELLSHLADDESLVPTDHVLTRLRTYIALQPNEAERLEAKKRFLRTEQLRISAADVLGLLEPNESGIWRTALAEAVLQSTIEDANPQVPVAVIGMGRFGGEELAYASDLDVVVVYEGEGAVDQTEAERVAQYLLDTIGNPTPGQQLYPLDYNLRPEGKKGLIARSLESCAEYYSQWAETWERQALIRARVTAGDLRVGAEFLDVVHPFVWEKPLTAEDLRTIRHLKARMENERVPRGEDIRFNLKLGHGSLSDVEWTVQLLQLQNGIPATNTLRAIERLTKANVLTEADALILDEAWRFCNHVRNRLFLINNGPTDAIPVNASRMGVLARSLEMHPSELAEQYLRVTRRARTAMERLFYGSSEE